jgi:hypothetical protein
MEMTSEQKKLTGQVLAGVLIVGFFITMVWERTITGGQIALLAGVAFGVLAKFLIPYVLKTHEGTMTPFDVRYVWTAIITFVYMLPIGLLLAEQLAPIMLPTFALIFLGVALGIGSNWTTEKAVHIAILLKGLYSAYGLQTMVDLITDETDPIPEEPTAEPEPPIIGPIEDEPSLRVEGDVEIEEPHTESEESVAELVSLEREFITDSQPPNIEPEPTTEEEPGEDSGLSFSGPSIGKGIADLMKKDKEEDDTQEPHWV